MSEEELEQINNLRSSKSPAPDGTLKSSGGTQYEIADLLQKNMPSLIKIAILLEEWEVTITPMVTIRIEII